MKYILLAYIEKAKREGMTEGEQLAMFDECFAYDGQLRASGHFAAGEALQPPETAVTLCWKNGKAATTDGPYAETKEVLGGTGVLEARDMKHAVQLMARHPALKCGSVFARQKDRRARQASPRSPPSGAAFQRKRSTSIKSAFCWSALAKNTERPSADRSKRC